MTHSVQRVCCESLFRTFCVARDGHLRTGMELVFISHQSCTTWYTYTYCSVFVFSRYELSVQVPFPTTIWATLVIPNRAHRLAGALRTHLPPQPRRRGAGQSPVHQLFRWAPPKFPAALRARFRIRRRAWGLFVLAYWLSIAELPTCSRRRIGLEHCPKCSPLSPISSSATVWSFHPLQPRFRPCPPTSCSQASIHHGDHSGAAP